MKGLDILLPAPRMIRLEDFIIAPLRFAFSHLDKGAG
jgi:hypothetical protein